MSDNEITRVRVDRWLWSARFFKTRSLATEACKKNLVKINNLPVKPSKEVQVDNIISIKLGPLQKIVQINKLTQKRVSAPLATKLFLDLTSPEAYAKAKETKIYLAPRKLTKKGIGRPTKKQRRELDEFLYPDS